VDETFTSSGLPSGWTIEDGASDGYTWKWSNLTNDIGNGSSGGYWWCNSEGSTASWDERLVTRTYHIQTCTTVTFAFNHNFKVSSGETAEVAIQVGSGSWDVLKTYSANTNLAETINVTSKIGTEKTFKFSFRYVASNGLSWKIDDVKVTGTQ
jgi:hypothetical protein